MQIAAAAIMIIARKIHDGSSLTVFVNARSTVREGWGNDPTASCDAAVRETKYRLLSQEEFAAWFKGHLRLRRSKVYLCGVRFLSGADRPSTIVARTLAVAAGRNCRR